jgi:peptidoglycan-N-acetylglucosamine deacetylase
LEASIDDTATHSRAWVPWTLGVVGAVLLAVVLGIALYLTVLTVTVRLDGKQTRLSSGTTVGDLFTRKLVTRRPGDLVSARDHHRVLRDAQGQPPFVSADGHPLAAGVVLSGGIELTSHDGSDTVEATRVTTETISIPVRYVGTGPVESVIESGSPGVREVTTGVISKQVVRKHVALRPVARLIRREELHPGVKTIALTFDDGPWPGSTKAILKILQQNGVVATFFEIGRQARQMPSLSKQVADAGMEMGNHSETHPLNLGRLSAAGVANEITRAQSDITRASGKAPKFFRPPGGNTTSAMYPVLSKLDLGWVQWDIDTDDWKRPSAGNIVSRVMRNVRPGAVVLMHDGGGDRSHTVQALPTIIKKLKAMGYVFVTVDALSSVPHKMG